MRRLPDLVATAAAVAVAGVGLACAATGGATSSTDLLSQDLAGLQYESLFELLEQHNKVRVATGSGSYALAVRVRTQGEMGSGGGRGEGLNPDDEGGFPESGGGGGGQGSNATAIGQGNYVAAKLYVDGSEEANAVTRLREISLDSIERLRILRPTEASSRLGGSGDFGAVAVTLKGDG